MTATASTQTSRRPADAVRTLRRASDAVGAGLAAWWNQLSTTGQLGTGREREIGRHTGGRI